MFEYLEGVLKYKKLEYIALDVNGVAYKIYISLREYERLVVGNSYRIYIHNYIREDIYKLVGFTDEKERMMFEKLINVKGVGLSLALSILSTFSCAKIIECIRCEDYNSLKSVPKLGEKKARLIILELNNNKLNTLEENSQNDSNENYELVADITLALESLGYSTKEINSILKKINTTQFSTIEEAIKAVLKEIKKEN